MLQVTGRPTKIMGGGDGKSRELQVFGAIKARFFENTCTVYSSLTQKTELGKKEHKKKPS